MPVPDRPDRPTVTGRGVNHLDITWDDVTGADSYTIRLRWHDGTNPRQDVRSNVTAGRFAGLRSGTEFTIDVAAVNSEGSSPFSESTSAYTRLPTPTGVNVASRGPDFLDIAWNSVARATSYDVRVAPGGTHTSNSNSVRISGLDANTTHKIEVRARSTGAGTSDFSAPINGLTRPPTPVGFQVDDYVPVPDGVLLVWKGVGQFNNSDGARLRLFRSVPGGAIEELLSVSTPEALTSGSLLDHDYPTPLQYTYHLNLIVGTNASLDSNRIQVDAPRVSLAQYSLATYTDGYAGARADASEPSFALLGDGGEGGGDGGEGIGDGGEGVTDFFTDAFNDIFGGIGDAAGAALARIGRGQLAASMQSAEDSSGGGDGAEGNAEDGSDGGEGSEEAGEDGGEGASGDDGGEGQEPSQAEAPPSQQPTANGEGGDATENEDQEPELEQPEYHPGDPPYADSDDENGVDPDYHPGDPPYKIITTSAEAEGERGDQDEQGSGIEEPVGEDRAPVEREQDEPTPKSQDEPSVAVERDDRQEASDNADSNGGEKPENERGKKPEKGIPRLDLELEPADESEQTQRDLEDYRRFEQQEAARAAARQKESEQFESKLKEEYYLKGEVPGTFGGQFEFYPETSSQDEETTNVRGSTTIRQKGKPRGAFGIQWDF